MRNPFKFLQEVKQEAFRISWPTKKDTMTGALNGIWFSFNCCYFFLLIRSNFKIFIKYNPKLKFLNELVYCTSILWF